MASNFEFKDADTRKAIQVASDWLKSNSAYEPINLEFEGIKFPRNLKAWEITLGYSKPWNIPKPDSAIHGLSLIGSFYNPRRSQVCIRVLPDFTIESMKPLE